MGGAWPGGFDNTYMTPKGPNLRATLECAVGQLMLVTPARVGGLPGAQHPNHPKEKKNIMPKKQTNNIKYIVKDQLSDTFLSSPFLAFLFFWNQLLDIVCGGSTS